MKNNISSFDPTTFDVGKYDSILQRGLCIGKGSPTGEMCIEAAICYTLGLPHGDDPLCVSEAVRAFKITLNDKQWSSPKARAKGLRDLGLAQLGSKGVVDDIEFVTILSRKIIGILIPDLFRKVFKNNPSLLKTADECEKNPCEKTINAAARAADAAADAAAAAAARAAHAAAAAAAAHAAAAARAAHDAAARAAADADHAAADDYDYYLIFASKLALETLRELNSPGCRLI
jgi:hypothetical protein